MTSGSSISIPIISVSRKQNRGETGNEIPHVSRTAPAQPVRDLDLTDDDSVPNCPSCNQTFPVSQFLAGELSYAGGDLASGAAIQLIFWGSAWTDPKTNPSAGAVTAAVQTLVDSAYFFPLKQYGVNPGPLEKHFIVTSPDTGSSVSSDDIADLLWDLIGDQFPEPDEPGGNNIYVVLLAPGVGLPDPTVASAHGATWRIVVPKFHWAWYAWIASNGGIEATTTNLSHEVVEAYTDPHPNGGWVVNGGVDPAMSEIGDLCEEFSGSVNGVQVKAYYSRFNNACIIPCSLSVRMLLNVKGIDGNNGIRVQLPPGACLREFLTS
jgi:hypothetical protein